jgi:hypothetical protein
MNMPADGFTVATVFEAWLAATDVIERAMNARADAQNLRTRAGELRSRAREVRSGGSTSATPLEPTGLTGELPVGVQRDVPARRLFGI